MMRMRLILSVLAAATLLSAAVAAPVPAAPPASPPAADAAESAEREAESAVETVCRLIETAAAAAGLPIGFFTRLIWKESAFRSDAVSPKGAQGIAQFMPGTALERGLEDPFDPAQAIPASAAFLRDLSTRFGNLGLAAAAYNAGSRRVEDWIAGIGGLPWETRDYVAAITGQAPEQWLPDGEAGTEAEAAQDRKDDPAECVTLAASLAVGRIPPAVAQAPWAPWGVQVAGHFSRAQALSQFASVKKRFPAVLGDAAPLVISSRNRSRGARPLYQVRIGAPSRERAEAVCDRLRAAGGSCVVLKN
ncbi:lytic transglycosylase domain-containing protein [Faunimonas sp. B44]|uniref:lytic transglycosylase domain-containing protein n=1 Tax=Faunimonas sp. B44 TaxID=3461493 RepID=UPI0040439B91